MVDANVTNLRDTPQYSTACAIARPPENGEGCSVRGE